MLTVRVEKHNSKKPRIIIESGDMEDKKAMLEIWNAGNPVVYFKTENGKFKLIVEASDA